jgi:2-oxoglutarate ferredoxin oxidoreductase subunit delta
MNEEPSAERPIEIKVNEAWCKSCVICVAICPKSVLEMQGGYPVVVNLPACTSCALCEIHCPDFAITVEGGRRKASEARKP